MVFNIFSKIKRNRSFTVQITRLCYFLWPCSQAYLKNLLFPLAFSSVRCNLTVSFCNQCIAWKMSKYGDFSGPYFPVFGLNTEIYGKNLRIQSEYRKIPIRKYSIFGHFSRSNDFASANKKMFDSLKRHLNFIIYDYHLYLNTGCYWKKHLLRYAPLFMFLWYLPL